MFEIKPNLWSPDGQMTERNGQCIFEDNYEWQNGISPVLFTDDEIKNPVKDSERNSNSSVNTETTKSKQHSGISTSKLTQHIVLRSKISNSSLAKHLKPDQPKFLKRSKLSFWINESKMNDKIAMRYTLPSGTTIENLLLSDLNRLNKMSQPEMVYDQFCMLVDDMNQPMSSCMVSKRRTVIRRASFPPSPYYVGLSPPLGGFAFETLFSPFTVSKTNLRSKEMVRSSSASSYFPDNPDKQDLCDIFDDVHLQNRCLNYFTNTNKYI